ncbi:MAG TPA: FGGY family carbohydrate kinase [Candidatus Bathyarchaeia archaeon]|nr:FGGY family carbohydrate kinase [Candidatus Bathyarchaeia archaeon]
MRFIGFDIGTTSCKATIFDDYGHQLGTARSAYPLHFDSSTCEQDPEIWLNAVCKVSKNVLKKARLSGKEIDAVACTGQFPSIVCLDRKMEPTRPAIIYSDGRATRECREIIAQIGSRRARKHIGLPLCFFPTLPLAKLLWLRRNEPQVFRKIRLCLGAKDFINLKLTGEARTDFLEAWWTGGVDIHTKNWSDNILADMKIPRDWFPTIGSPFLTTGFVTVKAAKQTDLSAGTPVMISSIDGMCAIMGAGVTSPGTFIDLGGATEIMGSLTRKRMPSSIGDTIFSWDYPENFRLVYTSTGSSGLALQWYRDKFLTGTLRRSYYQLDETVRRMTYGPGEILFLPHLLGEFSPFYDPAAKGVIFGLTLAHSWIDVYRSILEGVAYNIRQNVEMFAKLGLSSDKIVSVGGASESMLWNQIKSDVSGLPVETREVSDTGCLGAAIIAAVGTGVYADVKEATEHMIKPNRKLLPNTKNVKRYDKLFKVYDRIYPSLKNRFKEIQS